MYLDKPNNSYLGNSSKELSRVGQTVCYCEKSLAIHVQQPRSTVSLTTEVRNQKFDFRTYPRRNRPFDLSILVHVQSGFQKVSKPASMKETGPPLPILDAMKQAGQSFFTASTLDVSNQCRGSFMIDVWLGQQI